MNIVRTGLLAAALLVPTVAYADNDCEALKPLLDQNPVIISYDPFDAANTMHGFNLQVRTQNCPESRNVFLQVGSDDPSVTNGHIITATGPGGVTIQATVTDRQSNNGGGQDDTFNLKVGTDTLYFFIDRGQVVPPGDYHAPLLAEERLDNGNNPQGDNVITPFDLIITVGPAVGLAPAIGTRIDLGELSANDTAVAPVQFDAYANVGYELHVTSDHDFELLRGGKTGDASIAYSPLLDSAALPVSDPRRDFDRPLGTDSRRRHSLNAQVPSVAGKPAGQYQDVLTVEISAKVGG